jgi:hypothetical protein
MTHGTNNLPRKSSSTFLSRFYINSHKTPFATCTTEIEAAMVQINVGSEILCDKVYFILYKEK